MLWLAYFVIPRTIFSDLTNYYMPNYARDTAKPIEESLIKSGAKKVCENGANGRGSSNMEPSYNAYYQFSMSDEQVIRSLQRIAEENGYRLNSTPSEDGSIQRFEDRSTKNNTYPDLEDDKIELSFSAYSDTSNKQLSFCGGKGLYADQTHTILILALRLPSFKSGY